MKGYIQVEELVLLLMGKVLALLYYGSKESQKDHSKMTQCSDNGCEGLLVGGEDADRQHGYELINYSGRMLYRGVSTGWAWFPISEIPWADKLIVDKEQNEAR